MSIKSYTKVIDNLSTFEDMEKGIETLYNAVSSTLGPWGRTVIIEKMWNPPHVTKDGVTVANEITLKDKVQNLAVEILRQAASKTASEAGDGTTSTIVMGRYLAIEGYKLCKELSIPPSQFKSELESIVKSLLEDLYANYSTKVDSYQDLFNVALVASNNDLEISKNVADAFQQIGEFGLVTVDKGNSFTTTINVTDGIRWDKSHPTPLLRNKDGSSTVVNNPKIFVTDLNINTVQEMLFLLQLQEIIKSPLVVICDDIAEVPLEILVHNVNNNKIPLYILRTPYIAQAKTDGYIDLAIITNGTFLSKYQGYNLEDITEDMLGSCDRVEIDNQYTYLLGRHGNKDEINSRIEYYKSKIEKEHFEVHLNYKERMGQLTSGSAIINIGGNNDVDIKEKYDRYDDTICAVRAAIKKGYCVGAGETYVRLESKLIASNNYTPVKRLMVGALSTVQNKILENKGTEQILELDVSKVIDPCLVVENVIRNSVGAALLLIGSGYSIIKDSIDE